MRQRASQSSEDDPNSSASLQTAGWREWGAFPELGIRHIKAKLDTGARTSALHTFYVEPYTQKGKKMVKFGVHPLQQEEKLIVTCREPVVDYRRVSDSGGHVEMRYVIRTRFVMGESDWPIELTLTNRDSMRFRLLIGRTALADRFAVDSGGSYLVGAKPKKKKKKTKR